MSFSVIAVAESDSYLKWAVHLLERVPEDARVEVVVACSPVRPSAAQQEAALQGTRFAGAELQVLSPWQLRRRIERDRPDAVLLACVGPTVHAFSEVLSRGRHRPVLVAGIPGIAIPARARAWGYRGAIDLFVVHSHREAADYEAVRVRKGKAGRVGLATLPFLAPKQDGDAPAAGGTGTSVVFATQAKVPRTRADRLSILSALDRLAATRPDLDVVVKTRGTQGEFSTHYEPHHYQDLWNQLVAEGRVSSPDAVRFASGSMARHLDEAAALVTVSSTAVLEAMARDVPVLLIDQFGVSARLINEVFVDSGCLGGLDALAAGDFRRPAPGWLAENYFHPAEDDTWLVMLEQLVSQAAQGALPPIAAGLDPGRSRRRRRRDRFRLTRMGSELVRSRQRTRQRVLHKAPEEPTVMV